MDVHSGRYSENVIQLFKCSLLRLRHEEEDHAESNYVEASIECKGTLEESISKNNVNPQTGELTRIPNT